ncbi:MAG: hypothetical protein ACREDT_12675 [Methylocella sp.]
MVKLREGCGGVAGYGGETKKPAACASMTLWFTVSALFGVTGMFVYRAVPKRMDTAMNVDAVLEPNVPNAVMIAG